jgi:hypothetical protein
MRETIKNIINKKKQLKMENNQQQAAQTAQETKVETQNNEFEPVGGEKKAEETTNSTGKSVKQWAIEHAVEIGIGVASFAVGVFTGRATKKTKKD